MGQQEGSNGAAAATPEHLSLEEWFKCAQRVHCKFYESLLDSDGRSEYVSAHLLLDLLEDQGGGAHRFARAPSIPEVDRSSKQRDSSVTARSSRHQSCVLDSLADEAPECLTFLHGYPNTRCGRSAGRIRPELRSAQGLHTACSVHRASTGSASRRFLRSLWGCGALSWVVGSLRAREAPTHACAARCVPQVAKHPRDDTPVQWRPWCRAESTANARACWASTWRFRRHPPPLTTCRHSHACARAQLRLLPRGEAAAGGPAPQVQAAAHRHAGLWRLGQGRGRGALLHPGTRKRRAVHLAEVRGMPRSHP